MHDLRVDVSGLREAIGVSLDIDVIGNPLELGLNLEDIRLIRPIRIKARLTNEGDCIDVKGNLTTWIELQCIRCLKDFHYLIERRFHLDYFRGRPKTYKGRLELKEGDFEDVYYQGDKIDLTDEIRNEIILGIPMKPICEDTCPGLCPLCGRPLIKARCSCQKDLVE